jgi:NAD/NADP transhydrogenase beta subunit
MHNCAGACHQKRRVCATPSLCGRLHTHQGLAVVSRGDAMHLPTDEQDDADQWDQTWRDALVWTLGAICGAVAVAASVVYFLSRGSL